VPPSASTLAAVGDLGFTAYAKQKHAKAALKRKAQVSAGAHSLRLQLKLDTEALSGAAGCLPYEQVMTAVLPIT